MLPTTVPPLRVANPPAVRRRRKAVPRKKLKANPQKRINRVAAHTFPSGLVRFPTVKQCKIKKLNVEAVALSLINSYANPSTEKVISRELEKNKLLFSASNDILPEHREYERTATTAVNTYLMPVISRYLEDLEKKMQSAELRIMQSNEIC